MSPTGKAVAVAGFAARVLISPPATSILESAAVVARLQSYGRVIAFNKGPTNDSEKQEMEVIYSSDKQMRDACKNSPIEVKANQQIPDPKIEDPYNVRGLQYRKSPAPKIITCNIVPKNNHRYTGQTVISQAFQPSYVGVLHESLVDSEAPMSLIDALGASSSGKDHLPLENTVQRPLDLMAAYRRGIQQHTRTKESQSQSGSQLDKENPDDSHTPSNP
ncbi:hypothetical protein PV10_00837 [Exophiala mesophila]|uniref:Uncharacterized protein n=1 Tax=Exophiala mesophila TaxID=212818 RepID=A0A0D1ZT32_EXOME|nr:uncharacterized protein PV10_00837 [Exophiala mesophila]KIV97034.1 hypothetical protein PV10_00837 [Exophiala mesophila]